MTVNVMRCILAATALIMLNACGGAPLPDYDYSQEPNPLQMEYVLGVADSIAINVWKNPEHSASVTIRPDGTITMPLIGNFEAAGKTPSQLKLEIESRLGKFMRLEGTEITIAVTNTASYRFTVSGEVNGPGIFSAPYFLTVAEAIAQAGGFSRFAKRDRMSLLRRDPATGEVRTIPLNYDLIEDGSRPDMNIYILAGDALFVP